MNFLNFLSTFINFSYNFVIICYASMIYIVDRSPLVSTLISQLQVEHFERVNIPDSYHYNHVSNLNEFRNSNLKDKIL